MAGKNYGSSFVETFGTTSPATGTAPTDATDGQPLEGLAAITCVISAAYGETLSGAGGLLAYYCDASPLSASGSAQSASPSVVRLGYDAQSGNFAVAEVVTGGTSGAVGTVFTDEDAGSAGTLNLITVTGTFVDNEALTGSVTGAATVNGAPVHGILIDAALAPFEVGQVLTGLTSRATGTIATIAAGVLTFTAAPGAFVDNEALVGMAQPRWVRWPAMDLDVPVGLTPARDFMMAAKVFDAPRRGRVKWVPTDIAFSAGSAGVVVHQQGQTYASLRDAGRWG